MKLEKLVGKHNLTGVDFGRWQKEYSGPEYEDAQTIAFELDGTIYLAREDPSDGYRSNMEDIAVIDAPIKNKFAPCEVLAIMRSDTNGYEKNEVLDCIDTTTGKVVLSVGTRNVDDYYPCWVAEFTPENMSINAK